MSSPADKDFTVTIAKTNDEVNEVRRFQANRYLTAGYIAEIPPNEMIDDEWVELSDYFVARTASGEIAGSCRFIPKTAAGLPILRHFEVEAGWRVAIEQSTAYELGALAADPERGSVAVAAFLYRQTVQRFRDVPEAVHLVASLDKRLFRAMRGLLYFPFEQVGDEQHYLGSKTIPAYLYLPDALQSLVDNAPDTARFFAKNDSLDEVNAEVAALRAKYPKLGVPDAVIDLTEKIVRTSVEPVAKP